MKVFSHFPLFEDLVRRLETERIRKAKQKKRQRETGCSTGQPTSALQKDLQGKQR